MKPVLRRILLGCALVLSLLAALRMQEREGAANLQGVIAASRSASEATQDTGKARVPADDAIRRLPLDRMGAREVAEAQSDPFRAMVWQPPPPPPAPPPPPPKPTAPPLPFQYMGKMEDPDTGKVIVYLARGNESLTASPGDALDSMYRFDELRKSELLFTYLPLSIKQRLPLGISE